MMYNNDIMPILAVPALPDNSGIRFLLPDDQINIDNQLAESVWNIIGYSNGYNSIDDIADKTGLTKELVHNIVHDLISLNIMYDSRDLFLHFHSISTSPDRYFRNLSHQDIMEYTQSQRKEIKHGKNFNFSKDFDSDLSKLIFTRRSCRSFSNKLLNKDLIGNICFHGYSIHNHAVPSGGALYPLKIYVLIEKDQINIEAGYYEYDAEQDVLVKFNDLVDTEQLKYCFNDESMPFGSNIQIIIAADLKRQTFKYSNRGYRLTLIEAGQVAQNICLYCQENSISTCELGGILDLPLMEELDLIKSEISPLLAIAIGFPSSNKRFDYLELKDKIENEIVGENKPVKSYAGHIFSKGSSFFGAYSSYGNKKSNYSGGTASSYPLALIKSLVEGYERNKSGQAHIDYIGPAKNISENWLNPNLIRPLSITQTKQLGLTQFNESLPLNWTKGIYKNSGENIFIPSDLVFYGNDYKLNQICYSDSSGVAAFTDYNSAFNKALLELIERDAIMRNWYNRKSPNKIAYEVLPLHVLKRIKYWESQGRKVFVLDMMSKFAPTIQVIILGDTYPCFVSGAATCICNIESAILQALREAEYSLMIGLKYPSTKSIKPEEVIAPEDHGLLYSSAKYLDNISWLWDSKNEISKLPIIANDMQSLMQKLNPIVIDLSDNDSLIKVIRVISEKCVPISFGYKMDYFSHPQLETVDIRSLDLPHYFN